MDSVKLLIVSTFIVLTSALVNASVSSDPSQQLDHVITQNVNMVNGTNAKIVDIACGETTGTCTQGILANNQVGASVLSFVEAIINVTGFIMLMATLFFNGMIVLPFSIILSGTTISERIVGFFVGFFLFVNNTYTVVEWYKLIVNKKSIG